MNQPANDNVDELELYRHMGDFFVSAPRKKDEDDE